MEPAIGNQPSKRPLRARTAFAYYVQNNFNILRREKPQMAVTDVMRELAKIWGGEDQQDTKEEYKWMANQDHERYWEAKWEWMRNFPEFKPPQKHQRKIWGAPVRNRNPFIIFQQSVWPEVRTTNPGFTQVDSLKCIAKRWKSMKADDRAPFIAKAKEDKERYIREKAEFRRRIKQRVAMARILRLQEQMEAKRADSGEPGTIGSDR